jgi:calcium-dependent protein kinase
VEDDYLVEDHQLGKGCNGAVFRAISQHGESGYYAIKKFDTKNVTKAERIQLRDEVEIFLSMDHPNVARLVDVYERPDEDELVLVMECQTGGELFTRVQEKGKFGEPDAAHAIWQMLLALNYLHDRGIVHRDIKLENFLCENEHSDNLKLIDFGFSKVSNKGKVMNGDAAGTPEYAAPEIYDYKYTTQCDVWSMGVVAFILLLGYMPFRGNDTELQNLIKSGKYKVKQEKWAKLSSQAKGFLESLLVVNIDARSTAKKALKHEFISQRDQTGRRYITPYGADSKLNVSNEIINALCTFAKASQFRRQCLSLMAWSLTPKERAEVRDAFIELDIKRQGIIKLQELESHLDNLDASRIGDEELQYSDFLGAWIYYNIAAHEKKIMSTFRRFDEDQSNSITLENLQKIVGRVFSPEQCAEIITVVEPDGGNAMSYDKFLVYLRGDVRADDSVQKTLSRKDRKVITRPAGSMEIVKSIEDEEEEEEAVAGRDQL